MLVVTEIKNFLPRLYKALVGHHSRYAGNDVDADMEISSEQCQSKKIWSSVVFHGLCP